MDKFLKAISSLSLVAFFGFQTINWFVLQTYRIKLDYQNTPVTQLQAERLLKQVRFIYFWLLSDYYTDRLKEVYFLAYNSPEVRLETIENMRRSLGRRMVRGLPKLQTRQFQQ